MVLTSDTNGNPISTRSVSKVDTGRHRVVGPSCPSSLVVRGVTGQEVDFVVSRGVSFVFSSSIDGQKHTVDLKMDVDGR